MVTLQILLATIGRRTLLNMLNSVGPQLAAEDMLTVVFDAKDIDGVYAEAEELCKSFACQVQICMEPANLGFGGHALRTKYRELLEPRDFVLHADDDDIYLPSAISDIKTACAENLNTLYLFRMTGKTGELWWAVADPTRVVCNLGTPNGAIPFAVNRQCTWENSPIGDGIFLERCIRLCPTKFIDRIIYFIRP